jgi:MarR family transcriptional regulator, organic hydroperoxide resistance regulator
MSATGSSSQAGVAPARPRPRSPGRRTTGDPGAEAWQLLSEIFRFSRERFMAVAAELDVSPQQIAALRHLEPGSPVPMNELASQMACDNSNVTGIVDRLERQGLVERRSAEHDRRVKMLVVTEKGAALREQIGRRLAQPDPRIAALSRADQRALRDILRRALGR